MAIALMGRRKSGAKVERALVGRPNVLQTTLLQWSARFWQAEDGILHVKNRRLDPCPGAGERCMAVSRARHTGVQQRSLRSPFFAVP